MVIKQRTFAQALEDNLRREYSTNEVEYLMDSWKDQLSEFMPTEPASFMEATHFQLTYKVEGEIGASHFQDTLVVRLVGKSPKVEERELDSMDELMPFTRGVYRTLLELVPGSKFLVRVFPVDNGEDGAQYECPVVVLDSVVVGGVDMLVIAYLQGDASAIRVPHRNQ